MSYNIFQPLLSSFLFVVMESPRASSFAVRRPFFSLICEKQSLNWQFNKREHVVSLTTARYEHTYYAVNIYNEVRERRVKGKGNAWRA